MDEVSSIKMLSLPYIVLLCMVLFAGVGSNIFQSDNPMVNPIGFIIYVLCNLYLFSSISRDEFTFIRVWFPLGTLFVWCIIHFYKDSAFQYISYSFLLLHTFTAYMIVRNYRGFLLYYLEQILYMLAVCGLIFWVFNNILGPDVLRMIAPFESSTYNNMYEQSGSFLLYTIGVNNNGENGVLGLIRNYGFCWEPGRYASMMVVGLTFYIIRVQGALQIRDKRLWIYIATIISTFSTTGYVATIIIIGVSYLFANQVQLVTKISFGIIMLVFVPWVFTMDFMGEKIKARMSEDSYVTNQNMAWLNSSDRVFTVDRFEGMALDAKNISEEPLFGYGLADTDSYVYQNISKFIVTSNGIMKPIAQFGLLLGILLYILLWKSSVLLSREHEFGLSGAFFLATLLISVSYNFFDTVVFLSLLFYPIFHISNSELSYE